MDLMVKATVLAGILEKILQQGSADLCLKVCEDAVLLVIIGKFSVPEGIDQIIGITDTCLRP